jgi:hypothetical protein
MSLNSATTTPRRLPHRADQAAVHHHRHRPGGVRSGRGSLEGRLVAADDWDSPEVNESIADDFGITR